MYHVCGEPDVKKKKVGYQMNVFGRKTDFPAVVKLYHHVLKEYTVN